MFDLFRKLFVRKVGGVSYYADSAIGFVRKNNEDNWYVNDKRTLFVVADGMGGGEMGEVASKVLVDMMRKVPDVGDFELRSTAVLGAFGAADSEIKAIAAKHGFKHMGTTGIALLLDTEDRTKAKVFHVGDSRLYHVSGGDIEQLTWDHTVGYELSGYTSGSSSAALANRGNPLAHVLTRAIGMSENSEVEVRRFSVGVGSRLVLCTDGVHDVLSDKDLKKILMMKTDPENMGKALSLGVVKAGAPDNFTYIIVKVEEEK